MNILYLRLKNFKGIKEGVLRRSEVEIDFTSLPDGLIAVTGRNGAGKTTLLDNMHHYRTMPFRGEQQLYDAVEGIGEKELITQLPDGRIHRSLLKINSKTRTMTATLDEWNPDIKGWSTIVDGRADEYDRKIDELFMPSELFFIANFRAQNAKSFTSYKKSDMKALFEQMLGIEYLLEKSISARQKKTEAKAKAEAKKSAIEVVKQHMQLLNTSRPDPSKMKELSERRLMLEEMTTNARSEISAANAKLAAIAERIKGADEKIKGKLSLKNSICEPLNRRLEQLQSQILQEKASHANSLIGIKAKINSLREKESSLRNRIKEIKIEGEKEEKSIAFRKQELEREWKAKQISLNTEIIKMRESEKEYETILSKKDEILSAAAELDKILVEVARINSLILKRTSLSEKRMDMLNKKEKLQGMLNAKQAELDMAGKHSEILEDVPCDGDADCPLLQSALTARKEIPTLKNSIEKMAKTISEMDANIASIEAQINELPAELPEELLSREEKAKELASKQDALAVASSAMKQLEQSIEQTELNISHMSARHDRDIVMLDENIESSRKRTNHAVDSIMAEIREIAKEMAAAEQETEEKKKKAQETINSIESERYRLAKELQDEENKIAEDVKEITKQKEADADEMNRLKKAIEEKNLLVAEHENRMKELQKDMEELRLAELAAQENEIKQKQMQKQHDDIQNEYEAYMRESDRWEILERGFGRNGLIALELELASPEISSIVNALLDEMGGRFTVRFETLRPKTGKRDEFIETFDIRVTDMETGTEKSLIDLSGGQRVWIDDAIARAIGLYISKTAGANIKSMLCDERDGALDDQKRREYFAMKRKALEIGNYSQEFFISHAPDLTAFADAVISLDKNGISIDIGNNKQRSTDREGLLQQIGIATDAEAGKTDYGYYTAWDYQNNF